MLKRKLPENGLNEEISSDSDADSEEEYESDRIQSEEEETVQEKKIRLAKHFIDQIQQDREENESSRNENAYIARKLEEDLQTKTGKLKKDIAKKYTNATIVRQLKGHKLSTTCVCIATDLKYLFSGSKDGSIIKWDFDNGTKLKLIKKALHKNQDSQSNGHSDEILSLALSDDGKFLASASRDRTIKIWNPKTCEFIFSFEGHRDAVSGLAFRSNSHQLFSCSFDRTVKVWNVDQLAYVETLFGHQDKVLGIDSFIKERCVTCGARDRSVRMWKIVEESQLVFNGTHFDSIDCISMLNEELFLTGSNDGTLAIWCINKKKPLSTIKNAHQKSSCSNELDNTKSNFNGVHILNGISNYKSSGWISSLCAYHNSDLIASGSDDGYIRVWQYIASTNSLKELFTIEANGFVNDLKFSADANYLIAAIGQEHKLGRWSINKNSKNSVLIVKLNTNENENTNSK